MDKKITDELNKKTTETIRKIPVNVIFTVLCVIILFVFIYALTFRFSAGSKGAAIGENSGTLVGKAVGSLEGITLGSAEGYEAGKAEGLTADDTEAELSSCITESGKLEVLVASGTYSDVLTIGEDPVSYAALLSQKYNAVFTVDLETAEVKLLDDGLHVLLDQPVVEFLPVGEIEKKNEYQKKGFVFKTGSAEDGYIAADNSINEIPQKAQQKLQSDESLMKSARNSAVTQITQLVNAVSLSKPQVFVEFRGGDDNG